MRENVNRIFKQIRRRRGGVRILVSLNVELQVNVLEFGANRPEQKLLKSIT